jgi:hypothetical protein
VIQRLVTNGDSYMDAYTKGRGHIDLAKSLGIPCAEDLSIGGSADTRVLRTCLKDSYQTSTPTFYLIGLGFLSRWEVPVLRVNNEDTFEGRWTNPQNQYFQDRWEHNWNDQLTNRLIDIKLTTDFYSVPDRLEDLMYRCLATAESLHSRGHRILFFQQADHAFDMHLSLPKFQLLENKIFIHKLQWKAVPYQLSNGVPAMDYTSSAKIKIAHEVPSNIAHPQAGYHQVLNTFLTNYIQEYKILE